MKTIAIILCKLVAFAGKLLKRGSSLPGKLALKLDKNILKKIKMPPMTLVITGSNGKTSTTGIVRSVLLAQGKKVVSNDMGSNQTEGVATALLCACTLGGTVRGDVALLESDERYCKYTLPQIKPTHLLITNLFRDQLTRNGHPEFIYDEIQRGLLPQTRLIYCADDPLVAEMASEHADSVGYGLAAPVFADLNGTGVYDDASRCPVCKQNMEFSQRFYAENGIFSCSHCSFKRTPPKYAVTAEKGGLVEIDGKYLVKPYIKNTLGVYNAAAAWAAAIELGCDEEQTANSISNFVLGNGRVKLFSVGENEGIFLLSKHENSAAYNQSLNYITTLNEPVAVAILVNSISRKYVANDTSWLWDVDFERLNRPNIVHIFLGGFFANDLANRFSYTGISPDKVSTAPTVKDLVSQMAEHSNTKLCLLTCFSDIGGFEKTRGVTTREAEAAE